jgi:hypothetical protein
LIWRDISLIWFQTLTPEPVPPILWENNLSSRLAQRVLYLPALGLNMRHQRTQAVLSKAQSPEAVVSLKEEEAFRPSVAQECLGPPNETTSWREEVV